MRLVKYFLAAAGVLSATCTVAAWQRVSSPHFIIYADQPPERLRTFAERLERFDQAVRQVRAMPDPPLGDGNRLHVFVLETIDEVQKLAAATPGMTRNLAGFYKTSSDGSVAFVPERSGDSDRSQIDDQETFFHEYAHHLMFSDEASPVPLWYAEGFAEFMSTASFAKDGSVTLGRVVTGRSDEVADKRTFPIAEMLSGKSENLTEPEWAQLYARGWLLTHFLTFEPSRKGQLKTYLRGVAQGVEPAKAAAVFGDLAVLDRNLHAYLGRNRLSAMRVAPEALKVGTITVAPLSPAAAEVMPLVMTLRAGVTEAGRPGLTQQWRAAAARHPADPFVQTNLAQVEIEAHDYKAARVAADRALAVEPGNVQAMVHKGRAILEQAALSEKGSTFAMARQLAQKANALDPEDPKPLMLFYDSIVRDSGRQTPNAIAALHQAARLAPQDIGLRLQSAWHYLDDGKLGEAKAALMPAAFDPHNRGSAKAARAAIARIDAGDAKGAQGALSGK